MNKAIPILIVLVIIVAAGGVFLFKGSKTEDKTEETPAAMIYSHQPSGLEISFPGTWEGKYNVVAGENSVRFDYTADNGDTALLFIFTIYPQTENMSVIEKQPNHKVILQNENYIVAHSIPLEISFEQGSEDFIAYTRMLDEIDDVISRLSFKDSISLLNKEISEYNKEPKYTIEADYPELPGEGNEDINAKMKELAESNVSAFKQRVIGWESPEFDGDFGNSLYFWYEPTLLDNKLISIKFFMSDYYAGAAHPNHYTASFNYDLENSQQIEMENLFSVGEDEYVSALDIIVRKKLEEEFEKMGAAGYLEEDKPLVSKHSTVNLTRQGLLFTFDPYEVAPYALGMFEIEVPFEEIKDILPQ